MKTQNDFFDEENYAERKRLTELIFEKAKKESMETAKTALANYIEDNSSLKFKTSIRMHDRYILGDKKQPIPTMFSLNSAAKYIGYINFADFCNSFYSEENSIEQKFPEEEIIKKEKSIIPKTNFRKTVAGIGVTAALGLGSYFGINALNGPQCMYWAGSQYEKIDCNENLHPNVKIVSLNEQSLNYLHKIEVSETTIFFEAGKPVVWYLKVDGKIEFYSSPGNHPVNDKPLKPVTAYIVDKYVK